MPEEMQEDTGNRAALTRWEFLAGAAAVLALSKTDSKLTPERPLHDPNFEPEKSATDYLSQPRRNVLLWTVLSDAGMKGLKITDGSPEVTATSEVDGSTATRVDGVWHNRLPNGPATFKATQPHGFTIVTKGWLGTDHECNNRIITAQPPTSLKVVGPDGTGFQIETEPFPLPSTEPEDSPPLPTDEPGPRPVSDDRKHSIAPLPVPPYTHPPKSTRFAATINTRNGEVYGIPYGELDRPADDYSSGTLAVIDEVVVAELTKHFGISSI